LYKLFYVVYLVLRATLLARKQKEISISKETTIEDFEERTFAFSRFILGDKINTNIG